jgi:S-adenosyl methyltransferase
LPDEWLQGVYGPAHESPTIDTSVARSARVYDYLLGGKDHFAADRTAGDQMIAALPNVVTGSRMNRAFLARAVRFLVAECGVRQFLDIGTGIPSAGNTHEVAQEIAPQTRVVYVDNDPIVLSHARALLTSTAAGAVAYLDADLRHPDGILRTAARTLDFQQPIALMMLMVLHVIPDADEPHQIVARFVDALPGGSYLALSHPPSDILPEGVAQVQQRLNAHLGPGASMTARSHDEVARFFDGMDLVPPGLVQVHQWRPYGDIDPKGPASIWCAVARKAQG